MRPFLVSQTNPRAMRTVGDALNVPMIPGAPRRIMIEPGHYPGFWVPPGLNCVVTAVGGPGSVTLDPIGPAATIRVVGEATLQGLNVRNGGGEAALWCEGGNVLAEHCTFQSAQAEGSVYACMAPGTNRPGRLALRGCRVHDGGVVYEDATGLIEDTEIRDVRNSGIVMERSSVEVRRCRIQHTGHDGMRVLAGSRLTLENTHISDAGDNGLLQGDSEATISDVRIERAEAGLHYGRGPITSRNLTVEDTATIAVYCDEEAVGTFANTEVRRAGKVGVYAGTGRGVTFTGGIVESCGSPEEPAAGVYTHDGARLTLQGTTIRSNTAGGLIVSRGLAGLTARGCEITGNNLGIVNSDLPGVVLEDNSIHDNPGGDRIGDTQG